MAGSDSKPPASWPPIGPSGAPQAEQETAAALLKWLLLRESSARTRGADSDWMIVSECGISPRQEFLSMVASGELTHSAMEMVSEARVRVYGEMALVAGRVTNTAHHRGQRFDADEWTTDVFVRPDGRWFCVLSHITAAAYV